LFVLFGLLFGLGSTYYRNELPHSSGRSGDYSTWWHPNMPPISIGEYLHIITIWPISANFEFVSLKPHRTTLPTTWKRFGDLITSSFYITLPSHQLAQQTKSFFFKLPYSFNHIRTLTFSLNALMGTSESPSNVPQRYPSFLLPWTQAGTRIHTRASVYALYCNCNCTW
jgi:hypothetical protein